MLVAETGGAVLLYASAQVCVLCCVGVFVGDWREIRQRHAWMLGPPTTGAHTHVHTINMYAYICTLVLIHHPHNHTHIPQKNK